MRHWLFSLFIVVLTSCTSGKHKADTIIVNATIYTVDSLFSKAEALAVKDGKFVAVGTSAAIEQEYASDNKIDANGKTIIPGIIDAHCHFYGLGLNQRYVDLTGTKNYDDVLVKVLAFQKQQKTNFILGRGWDQNDWDEKRYPTKKALDLLFPKTPVALTRVDGHAMLCNQAALDLAKITKKTKVKGGEIVKEKGELIGVLIDEPMALVQAIIPKPTKQQSTAALLEAQKLCNTYGVTTVSDAGLSKDIIELIDELQQNGKLQTRVYAMVNSDEETLNYYLNKGKIKTDRLNIRAVKVYADGALGSRGAALQKPYSDSHNHYGAMVTSPERIKALANKIVASDYQMNTHAIGDSANAFVLHTYNKVLHTQKNRRWRIEHAQVINPNHFTLFNKDNIIPSVQPTHATSDMYWAKERLGETRLKGAYAYKTLLNESGRLALGTDFPVEQVNPFLTFYAAVARKDEKNYPENGFQKQEALTRVEALKGMTIWAAFANFEEHEKGSIEVGKLADFVILDANLMTIPETELPKLKVQHTYINGMAQ